MQKKIVYQHKPDVILSTQIIYGSIKKKVVWTKKLLDLKQCNDLTGK